MCACRFSANRRVPRVAGQHPFDLLDLELRLVAILDDLAARVLLQDARCLKCSRVATGSLTLLCAYVRFHTWSTPQAGPCSGKYAFVDAPLSKFRDYLSACLDVATKLDMAILQENCRGHLENTT